MTDTQAFETAHDVLRRKRLPAGGSMGDAIYKALGFSATLPAEAQ